MTEAFLQYVWKHQMFDHRLSTTSGQPVVVVRAGEHNHDAGPDFLGSRVTIDGIEWAGNVEVHVRASEWERHGHTRDKAYNNVVLHVVYEQDKEIVLSDGRMLPTVELKDFLNPAIVENYEKMMAPEEEGGIGCERRVSDVPEFILNSFVQRMSVERIETKSADVRRLLEESHGGWEQVCYLLMARYFGGKVNGLAFEILARATDQRLLARWKDNQERVEALLMGQAGLLEGYFEDDYPRKLQADYDAIRMGVGLHPMDGSIWKFYRIRPSSFPTIRISQFANMVCESKSLFATLLKIEDAEEMVKLFDAKASEYWNGHYRFDVPVEQEREKRMGRMQAELLIINAWVPLLFVYGSERGQEKYKDQAISLEEQLAAEDNAIIRKWRNVGIKPKNAADSQALLHLYKSYCTERRCLECGIGYQILRKK